MPGPTFDDITGAYLSSVSGRAPPTAPQTVLTMMGKLGEVATACTGREAQPWTAFERSELQGIVGELAISLCALGAALDIDVGAAAADAARERCANATKRRKETLRPSDAAAPAAAQPAAASLTQTPPHLRPPPLTNNTSSPPAHLPAARAAVASAAAAAAGPAALTETRGPKEETQRWAERTAPPSAASHNGGAGVGPLSPRTTEAFFPELDKICARFDAGTLTPAEYEALGLSWCVIDDLGAIIDIIPDGRHKHVAFHQFNDFRSRAQVHRTGRPPAATASSNAPATSHHYSKAPPPLPPSAMQSGGALDDSPIAMNLLSPTVRAAPHPGSHIQRIRVGRADEMERDAALFSPDHFKAGLLSPYQPLQYVDVEFTNDKVLPPPAQQSPAANASLPITQALPPSIVDTSAPASPPKSAPMTDAQVADFWSRVSMIETGEASGKAVATLGLTLTMPVNKRMVPLTTNGEYISVTQSNAEEYLSLLREQQDVQQGKLRRSDSVKTIMMPDSVANYKSEMVKYGHDRWATNAAQITAPAPPARKSFHVDYDERSLGEVLPAALQRKALPSMIPSAAHYLEFILVNPESFRDVFAAVTRDRSLLERLQVTYCVPDPNALLSPHFVATLPRGARPRCGALDLITDGRHIRVTAADFDRYYQLVREASRNLPPSVAPGF